MVRKKPYLSQSIVTFKKWPFVNDLRIETEDGKVSLLYANIAPK